MRDEEAGSTRDDKIVVDVAELEPARAARGPAAPRVHADGSDPGRALPTPAAGSSKTVAGLVSNQTVVLRAAPPVIGKPRAPKPTSQTSIGAGIFAAPRTITGEQWAEGEMPSVGAHIHHYELIRELGAGGMGTVYLARDERLGRKVAIKVLQSQAPELALRFLIEARATARCHHENIVVIYEVGQVNPSQPYMVLEFLKGQPLSDQLPEGQPLPVPRCVELLTPVLRALVCAHAEGIVHRDLKPDNIFVTDAGGIKVLDFGIAKVFAEDASEAAAPALTDEQRRQAASRDTGLTMPGTMMGTLQYMAPEQFGIGIEIDARTDVWAMGVILFRMLTGRGPLYPLEGNELLVTAIMDQPMPRLRDVAPQLPRALADVVDRCLMKDPAERWPTAAALLDALAPFSPGRYSPRALGQDESPYAGLASFQESDAGRFFGRSREIAAAALRIRDRPIMAIAGPSGVGKSSFVRAGLVPALKAAGENWECHVLRPGRNPLAALAGVTARLMQQDNGEGAANVAEDVEEQQFQLGKLREQPGHLGMVLRQRAKRTGRKVLLFVDQFEELYTLAGSAAERLAFTAALAGAADDATAPIRLVLSLRSDYLDRVAEDPAFLAEVTSGLVFLNPPDREGKREALRLPAEMAGYRFESPAIIDDMLAHLERTPGALPLLQFAATRLWEKRDVARKLLSRASYDEMGGISGALATHADAVVEALPPASQALVRTLVLRLLTAERTRAIVPFDELAELAPTRGEAQRLIDHLVAARLLVVQTAADGAGGVATVELVHESLVTTWPTLRRWLDENSEDVAFLDQLRVAAKQWHDRGRAAGLLWRGDAAAEAIRFARRGRDVAMADVQRAFLAAVVADATRADRRRRQVLITIGAVLVLLLIAAGAALWKIRGAETKATEEAIAAKAAEGRARKALAEAQEQERQRQAAESAKAAALSDKAVIKGDLDQAYLELRDKAAQLEAALTTSETARTDAERLKGEAELARDAASKSQKDAEREAANAVAALAAAEAAKKEAQVQFANAEALRKQEEERRKRVEAQLGSAIVDTLK
jgi:serine/threonine protein kinase